VKALEAVEILPARFFRSGYFYLSSHNTTTVESHTERTKMMMRSRKEVRCINRLSYSPSSPSLSITAKSLNSEFARMLLMSTFDSDKRFGLVYVRRNGGGGDQRKIERMQKWEGCGVVITIIHGTSFRGLIVEED